MSDGNKFAVLCDRIKLCRGEMSQEELGKHIGVSREIIQHWERGSRQVKAEHLIMLAKEFGVSTDFLLGLTDVKAPEITLQSACNYTGIHEDVALMLNLLPQQKREVINKILASKDFLPLVNQIIQAAKCQKMDCYIKPENLEDEKMIVELRTNADDDLSLIGRSSLSTEDISKFYCSEAALIMRKIVDEIVARG